MNKIESSIPPNAAPMITAKPHVKFSLKLLAHKIAVLVINIFERFFGLFSRKKFKATVIVSPTPHPIPNPTPEPSPNPSPGPTPHPIPNPEPEPFVTPKPNPTPEPSPFSKPNLNLGPFNSATTNNVNKVGTDTLGNSTVNQGGGSAPIIHTVVEVPSPELSGGSDSPIRATTPESAEEKTGAEIPRNEVVLEEKNGDEVTVLRKGDNPGEKDFNETFYLTKKPADSIEVINELKAKLGFKGSLDLISHLAELTSLNNDGKIGLDCVDAPQPLKDNDPITFDEVGKGNKRILTNSKDIEDVRTKHDLELFMAMLKATYGLELAKVIGVRYGLVKFENKEEIIVAQEPLTLGKIKECMVGASANFTENDLRHLFKQIKSKKCDQYILCGTHLATEQLDSVSGTEDFSNLTPEQIDILTIPFTRNGNTSTSSSLVKAFFDPSQDKLDGTFTPFIHDMKIAMQNVVTIPKEFNAEIAKIEDHKDLFVSEYLAKVTAYLELQPGMLIKIQDHEGNPLQFLKVHNKLHNRAKSWYLGDAVFSQILTPINSAQGKFDEANSFPVYVVPRGVQIRQDALGGVYQCVPRMLDFQGVGKTQYEAHKKEILAKLYAVLGYLPEKNINLILTGHSMGGADTHRLFSTIIEALAPKPISDPTANAKVLEVERNTILKNKKFQFNVITHNPPHHEITLDEEFTNHFQRLDELEMKKAEDDRIRVSHTILYYEGDPVHEQTPGVFLGRNVKSSLYNPRVIKFVDKEKNKLGGLQLHGLQGVGKQSDLVFSTVYKQGSKDLTNILTWSGSWKDPSTWGETYLQQMGWLTKQSLMQMLLHPTWKALETTTNSFVPLLRKMLENIERPDSEVRHE